MPFSLKRAGYRAPQFNRNQFAFIVLLVAFIFLTEGVQHAKALALRPAGLGAAHVHALNRLYSRQRETTYDPVTDQCVCADTRRFNVLPGLAQNQKAGYCINVCGAPVTPDPSVSDSSPSPSPTSAQTVATSTTMKSQNAGSSSVAISTTLSSPSQPTTPTSTPKTPSSTAPSLVAGSGPSYVTGTTSTIPEASSPPNQPSQSNDSRKIGLGAAIGVIVAGVMILCLLLIRRRREKKKSCRNSAMIMCRGASAGHSVHDHDIDIRPPVELAAAPPLLDKKGEKYIYSNGPGPTGHPALFGHNRSSLLHSMVESPNSIPPAYSSSAMSHNSSTSSVVDPPMLPLGAPSRAIDWPSHPNKNVIGASSSPNLVPQSHCGNSSRSKKHAHTASLGSINTPVNPPSITFFLHPVKKDEGFEDDELKWLDSEQRRIREKAEAVKELNKLKEEEERLKKRIRERTLR